MRFPSDPVGVNVTLHDADSPGVTSTKVQVFDGENVPPPDWPHVAVPVGVAVGPKAYVSVTSTVHVVPTPTGPVVGEQLADDVVECRVGIAVPVTTTCTGVDEDDACRKLLGSAGLGADDVDPAYDAVTVLLPGVVDENRVVHDDTAPEIGASSQVGRKKSPPPD